MLDTLTTLLSYPFSLISRLLFLYRSAIVCGVLCLLGLCLWRILRKPRYAVWKAMILLNCWIQCYWLYDLRQPGNNSLLLERRNQRVERLEAKYFRLQASEESGRHKRLSMVLSFLLFFLLWGSIALSSCADRDNYQLLATAANAYRYLESPVLQKVRSRPYSGDWEPGFDDVIPGNWNFEGIRYVCVRGIVQSNQASFQPDQPLSRQVLAVMLYQYAGEPPAKGLVRFTDISPALTTYPAMLWAVEQDIFSVGTDRRFEPTASISYEQALTILYRYAIVADMPVQTGGSLLSAAEPVSEWAQKACEWAAEQGILVYSGDGLFYPKQQISKGWFCVLLYRLNEWASGI